MIYLKEQVDELVNYLGSEDEGFIQDSQNNGLLDAHIGFFVSYKKVIEACGGGIYGSNPLELITDMRNLIDQQAAEIERLEEFVDLADTLHATAVDVANQYGYQYRTVGNEILPADQQQEHISRLMIAAQNYIEKREGQSMTELKEKVASCELCGHPMPEGEQMFKFHGYSGPCPAPPSPDIKEQVEDGNLTHPFSQLYRNFRCGLHIEEADMLKLFGRIAYLELTTDQQSVEIERLRSMIDTLTKQVESQREIAGHWETLCNAAESEIKSQREEINKWIEDAAENRKSVKDTARACAEIAKQRGCIDIAATIGTEFQLLEGEG